MADNTTNTTGNTGVDTDLNIYYAYDPDTLEYVGARFADKCPDNATAVEPVGFVKASWNKLKKAWEGKLIADQIAEMKANAEQYQDSTDKRIADEMAKAKESAANYVDPNQKQLSEITQIVMKQLAQQTAEIAQLKAQIKGGN